MESTTRCWCTSAPALRAGREQSLFGSCSGAGGAGRSPDGGHQRTVENSHETPSRPSSPTTTAAELITPAWRLCQLCAPLSPRCSLCEQTRRQSARALFDLAASQCDLRWRVEPGLALVQGAGTQQVSSVRISARTGVGSGRHPRTVGDQMVDVRARPSSHVQARPRRMTRGRASLRAFWRDATRGGRPVFGLKACGAEFS